MSEGLRLPEAEEELLWHVMNGGDIEAGHAAADDILVRELRRLGYNTLCDLYEQVEKWYA